MAGTTLSSLRMCDGRAAVAPRAKVAYLMSGFPHLTETFILYEMLAVEKQGIEVAIYPLQRGNTSVMHPEAAAILPRAQFQPLVSPRFLRAHGHYVRHAPRAYFGALGTLLRATWGSLRYFAGAVAFFPKLVHFARAMQAEGVTHVHAHFASHPAAAALVIRRLTGIPYSFTAHGSDLHRDRHMLREKVAEAAFVVAISRYNRDLIVSHCGGSCADKVAVIHCGVDTEMFRPLPGGRPPGRPASVLCVATMHEVKGQRHLLDACRILRERGLPFTCHLVGDGPDRAALVRQAAETGLDGSVEFHGRLPRSEVIAMLQRADVLAAPSVPTRDGRREGIPVALMEAMASGVPVVASRLSGIPELVEDGVSGLLVPPGDAGALAGALQRLIASPSARAELARAAREKIVREFDLDRNAAALAARITAGRAP